MPEMPQKKGVLWKSPSTWLMAVAFHGIFFFHGCDDKKLHVTTGFVIPFAELVVSEVKLSNEENPPEFLLPTSIVWWSPQRLIVNVIGSLAVALLFESGRRRYRLFLHIRAAFWGSAVLFDSFLVFASGWVWTVFYPTVWLTQVVVWIGTLGATTNARDFERLLLPWTSRLWFLLVVFLLSALLWCLHIVWRHTSLPPAVIHYRDGAYE